MCKVHRTDEQQRVDAPCICYTIEEMRIELITSDYSLDAKRLLAVYLANLMVIKGCKQMNKVTVTSWQYWRGSR